MKSFIKKIFEDEIDDSVHQQFQKFSRGTFKNKALINAKHSKGRYSISTTSEYANELVRTFADKLGASKTNVTGVVVSTSDLEGKLDYKTKKQFMGIKQYIIDAEISGDGIIKLCEEFPDCFMGLSFKIGTGELKIKPKAPKSAKPSNKAGEKPKVDFCKIKTEDKEIVNSLIFETNDFKFAEIEHDFVIDDLEIPAGVTDLNEMRKQTKRKGKIVRRINIDDKIRIEEKDFVA